MKKYIGFVYLLCGIFSFAIAGTNSVSPCTFLDNTDSTTAFDLSKNTTWLTNIVFYAQQTPPDDPGTNRVGVWQSDGTGLGNAGDLCYKKNVGGTVTSGYVGFVEANSLLTLTQTLYSVDSSGNGVITNVFTYTSSALTSWTTNGVTLP